jgi:hypothetical protein
MQARDFKLLDMLTRSTQIALGLCCHHTRHLQLSLRFD